VDLLARRRKTWDWEVQSLILTHCTVKFLTIACMDTTDCRWLQWLSFVVSFFVKHHLFLFHFAFSRKSFSSWLAVNSAIFVFVLFLFSVLFCFLFFSEVLPSVSCGRLYKNPCNWLINWLIDLLIVSWAVCRSWHNLTCSRTSSTNCPTTSAICRR